MVKTIKFWLESSREDLNVARLLYESEKYSYCLFFCHLSLEKIIKGVYVAKKKGPPPYSHDLIELCAKAKIELTKEQYDDFTRINGYNVSGRYPAEKSKLYSKATAQLTGHELILAQRYFRWLKKKYLKKYSRQ